jgi:hypothetical protein
MNLKKSLESRIHGWLPKAPSLPTVENAPLQSAPQKQTFLPAAGGIVTIISGFAIFFISLFELIPFITYCYFTITGFQFNNNPYVFQTLSVGLVGVFCFTVNLKAASLAAKRERYGFSVAGPILLLLAGVLTMLLIGLTGPVSLISYLRFGLPVATLSLLSLVFIVASRKEFTTRRIGN